MCDSLHSFQTVYLLVDNRDLTTPVTESDSLRHWPSVAVWWKRRLALKGPSGETCDLVFVPIAERSGLQHVHPTWAGTFVLSAIAFLLPSTHFVLLDSDCLPVTLFEVGDLWKEAMLGLDEHFKDNRSAQGSTEGTQPKAHRSSCPNRDPYQVGQGVLLVTEHNAEINAGFIVVFASKHTSPVGRRKWLALQESRVEGHPRRDEELAKEGDRLTQVYWAFIEQLLSTAVPASNMSEEECGHWVQSGLALTPFAGCHTRFSVDWAICWSLIGEWTCRELFPPPVGPWPRNGHPRKLNESFAERRPPILTWARSCFEQGSLPSMLHLPGNAVMMVLPGDKMFQAQCLVAKRSRPAILHGYGGAKQAMPNQLTRLASGGWAPLATAMVGVSGCAPAWPGEDLRPVVGTSVDFRVVPEPLSKREELLLLSMWKRVPADQLPPHCAVATWLSAKKDLPANADPGGERSPHAVGVSTDISLLRELTCWNVLWQEPKDESETKHQLLALRILAYTMTEEQLSILVRLLLGDDSVTDFPHSRWCTAVKEMCAGYPLLKVTSKEHLTQFLGLLPPGVNNLMASTATGETKDGQGSTFPSVGGNALTSSQLTLYHKQ